MSDYESAAYKLVSLSKRIKTLDIVRKITNNAPVENLEEQVNQILTRYPGILDDRETMEKMLLLYEQKELNDLSENLSQKFTISDYK